MTRTRTRTKVGMRILTVSQLKAAISNLDDRTPILGIDEESCLLVGFTEAHPDTIEGSETGPINYLHLNFTPYLGTIDELAKEIQQ